MRLSKLAWTAGGFAAVGAGVWAVVHFSRTGGGATTTAPVVDGPDAAVVVTTDVIKSGELGQTITAYGVVTAEPGVVSVLSAGVECRVRRLHVAGGQGVESGAAVIEVEPSPDAKVQLFDARAAVEGAKKEASSAHQRLELKLSTTTEVQSADRAVTTAEAKVDELVRRGAGDPARTITAAGPSVVAKVDVQEGQLVAAGGPLVELVPRGRIEIRLGVEPVDASSVRPGQSVRLFPSTADEDDEPIDGTVRVVTRRVNPESRLVDVFASPAETDRLLLDGLVRGELTVRTVSGLVVPHESLLPDDKGFVLFTVKDGKAVKHAVKVALQDDKYAVVTGEGLHEGDAVVTAGALEVDDGKPVTATAAAASEEAEK